MRVLVACEESQAVCEAFRARGHEAYSCDVQHCALYGHLDWHIVEDAREIINGRCSFQTVDGQRHKIEGGVGHGDRPSALHLPDAQQRRAPVQ